MPGIRTRTNLSIKVWETEKDAQGNIRYVNGKPVKSKLVKEFRFRNVTNDALLFYKNFWLAKETATTPVNRVKVSYGESLVDYCTTSFVNDGMETTFSASWTNSTGETQTVSQADLGNRSAFNDIFIAYCSKESLSVEIADTEVMEVTWDHTHTSSGEGITVEGAVLEMLRDCMTGDLATSSPLSSMTFVDDNEYPKNESLGTIPYSGGTTETSTTVWKVNCTAYTGAHSLEQAWLYLENGEKAWEADDIGEDWLTGEVITATITVTQE